MGSIDKALPHAGFYPDSQNICSDAAKIGIFRLSSKFYRTFFSLVHQNTNYHNYNTTVVQIERNTKYNVE